VLYTKHMQVFVFIIGAIVGSFLNVVVLRYNTGRSLAGRSGCMTCGEKLAWRDLIPIVSYFTHGGHCQACHSRISFQYPVVEIITGLAFVFVAELFPPLTLMSAALFMVAIAGVVFLLGIVVYDVHHGIIPDGLVYGFIICGLLFRVITDGGALLWPLLAGPLVALPFVILWSVSKGRWMGFGDAKLALGMGWFLGIVGGYSAVIIAFWIGAVWSVSVMALGMVEKRMRSGLFLSLRRLTMKSEVPFAPFLALGFILVFLFGLDVISLFS